MCIVVLFQKTKITPISFSFIPCTSCLTLSPMSRCNCYEQRSCEQVRRYIYLLHLLLKLHQLLLSFLSILMQNYDFFLKCTMLICHCSCSLELILYSLTSSCALLLWCAPLTLNYFFFILVFFFSNHTTPSICLCSCKLIISSCAATSKYLRHIPMPTPYNHFPQEDLYLDLTPSMFQMLGTYDLLWAHGK